MDLIAMAASILGAILLAVIFYKRSNGSLRAIPLFFVLFGPMAINVHMALHFVGVGIVASSKMAAGSFTYDFRFYSLLLMGGLLSVLGFQLVKQTRNWLLTGKNNAGQRALTCGWLILVAAPTIPFTFIGSLPVQAVIIYVVAAQFVFKKHTTEKMIQITTAQETAEAIA